MKVIIGPYRKHNKKTGVTPERKISVRIDKFDTWNLNHTLALIILPCLKQLKKSNHGAPCTDDEDVPKKLRSTSAPKKKNEWDTDKYHFKRWDWIMDEMIWAFEQELDEDSEDQFHTGKIDTYWQDYDKNDKKIGVPYNWSALDARKKKNPDVTYHRMVKGPKDTHKYDKKGHLKFLERKKNGLRLFGCYFNNLWD